MAEHWVKFGKMCDAMVLTNVPGEYELRPELKQKLEEIAPSGKLHIQNCPYDKDKSALQVTAYFVFTDKNDALKWRMLHGGDYYYVENDTLFESYSFSVRLKAERAEEYKLPIKNWMKSEVNRDDWRWSCEENGDYLFQFRNLRDAVYFRQIFTDP